MSKFRILVVDDDAIFLMLSEKFLEKADFNDQVETFTNGKKAFDYLEDNYTEEEHYIVLLDLNMPVMDGWGFLDSVIESYYSTNMDVYIVTSSTNQADINKSKDYSIVKEYISKPLSVHAVRDIKANYFD